MKTFLILFLCLSCYLDISAQKPVVINLARAISKSPEEIMLSELASDVKYIPLETTDDCLIGNEFYIMQYTGEDIITSGIFHFNKDGKFVRSILEPKQNMSAAGLLDENHILYSNDMYYTDKQNPIQLYLIDSQTGKTASKWRGHLEEKTSERYIYQCSDKR